MRRRSLIAGLAGALVLSLTVGAGAAAAKRATAAAAKRATAAAPAIAIHPGVVQSHHVFMQPPTTALCEAALGIACYAPTQIEQAYGTPQLYAHGVDGAGQTIIIVDSYGSPTIVSDLETFDQSFGLPDPPSLRIYQPAGRVPPFDPNNATMASWAGETTLDVEYAHAIAPAANIVLLETPVAETTGATGFPQVVRAERWAVDHNLGGVISQSFATTEQTFPSAGSIQSLRSAYIDAYAHGITVLGSTGDSGAANVGLDGATFYTYPTVNWPATDPLVTAVGGTELNLDANGNHLSPDVVWNDTYNTTVQNLFFGNDGPNPLATGGGLSTVFPRPFYQNWVANVVGNQRGVPDISMSGACSANVLTYQSFVPSQAGFYLTCGTSEASPLFAGVVALADQVAGHPLGLINPALYTLAAEHAPGLVDVTSGNNTVGFSQDGNDYTVQGYSAGPGYDLASGLGTVYAPAFVYELAQFGNSRHGHGHDHGGPHFHH